MLSSMLRGSGLAFYFDSLALVFGCLQAAKIGILWGNKVALVDSITVEIRCKVPSTQDCITKICMSGRNMLGHNSNSDRHIDGRASLRGLHDGGRL